MYTATVENKGDTIYYATTRHSSFVMGTDGQGANPVDAMLASLCACIGHYARDYLRDHQIPGSGFIVRAEGKPTKDGSRLGEVTIHIELKDAHVDAQRREELIRTAELCKIYNTLKAGCAIRITVHPVS